MSKPQNGRFGVTVNLWFVEAFRKFRGRVTGEKTKKGYPEVHADIGYTEERERRKKLAEAFWTLGKPRTSKKKPLHRP